MDLVTLSSVNNKQLTQCLGKLRHNKGGKSNLFMVAEIMSQINSLNFIKYTTII